MPIYEGWKLWKRNVPTTVYNPRVFSAVLAGYITFSMASSFIKMSLVGIVKYQFNNAKIIGLSI